MTHADMIEQAQRAWMAAEMVDTWALPATHPDYVRKQTLYAAYIALVLGDTTPLLPAVCPVGDCDWCGSVDGPFSLVSEERAEAYSDIVGWDLEGHYCPTCLAKWERDYERECAI